MADSKIDDGGSAYPVPEENYMSDGSYSNHGMSLRDWFAGQALAGMLATDTDNAFYKAEKAAERSYRMADAMIAARKGGAS